MRRYISALTKYTHYFMRNRRGASALIFAICAVPLLLAAGGAIDFTRYYNAQQNTQAALDAAVLAGAAADDPTSTYDDTLAQKTFAAWKMDFDGTVETPDFTPRSSDDAEVTYPASVKVSLNMMVMSLIGISKLDFTVTSTAVRNVTEGDSTDGGTCLWITTNGLTMNSGGTLSAPACEVDVLGGTSSLNSGSTVVTPSLCIATGLNVNQNGGSVTDSDGNSSLNTSCTTTSYTIPATAPSVSCDNAISTQNTTYDDSTVTLSPGTYCGGVTFHGGSSASAAQQITLEPGMYIIKNGDFIFENYANVTGTGVTFYLADTHYIYYNSNNVSSVFSAPTSGDCEDTNSCGVLMYEADGLSTSYMSGFDAGNSHDWTGDIYLPSRIIQENSSANITLDGDMVIYGMTINSSSEWKFSSDGSTSTTTSYSTPHLTK